ncbi:hypothetical protein PAXINDRAFT_17913 [Paxillus involutus ATCC 200175]|uniref:Uncharacterized protein n=1 Tax=Paxillus involutus ATCC 200175 TaxID=664439 RepID=A0A0C9TP59_PAXIN|nr:hypothetical protein PAXINDRAFT_17913 [Paxillus involutus ATCC 200175]
MRAMLHAAAAAGVYDLKMMAFKTMKTMVRAGESLLNVPRRRNLAVGSTTVTRYTHLSGYNGMATTAQNRADTELSSKDIAT